MPSAPLLVIIALCILIGGAVLLAQNDTHAPSDATDGRTRVEAPGTTVESDREKTRIQAPGVDITVPRDKDRD